mmetsp:Transcript_63273/g.165733  ORF Transcript_63273/g.165733 Transcript_63273/m.165733 type:complete len:423 (+) Transcript_63273:42-1310(+)
MTYSVGCRGDSQLALALLSRLRPHALREELGHLGGRVQREPRPGARAGRPRAAHGGLAREDLAELAVPGHHPLEVLPARIELPRVGLRLAGPSEDRGVDVRRGVPVLDEVPLLQLMLAAVAKCQRAILVREQGHAGHRGVEPSGLDHEAPGALPEQLREVLVLVEHVDGGDHGVGGPADAGEHGDEEHLAQTLLRLLEAPVGGRLQVRPAGLARCHGAEHLVEVVLRAPAGPGLALANCAGLRPLHPAEHARQYVRAQLDAVERLEGAGGDHVDDGGVVVEVGTGRACRGRDLVEIELRRLQQRAEEIVPQRAPLDALGVLRVQLDGEGEEAFGNKLFRLPSLHIRGDEQFRILRELRLVDEASHSLVREGEDPRREEVPPEPDRLEAHTGSSPAVGRHEPPVRQPGPRAGDEDCLRERSRR